MVDWSGMGKLKQLLQFQIKQKYQARMIYTSSQYFSRKQKIRSLKNSIKNQIVKLAIFVLLCVLVGSLVDKNRAQNTYTIYYAQNKIVNKHSRGVFPPLEGYYYNLHGCWDLAARIGKRSIDRINFKNYTICFQQTGTMTLKKIGPHCQAPTNLKIYQWKAFSHNLFISEQKAHLQPPTSNPQNPQIPTFPNLKNPSTMISKKANADQQNDQENRNRTSKDTGVAEVSCFSQKEPILDYIRSFTVWTVREGNVYLISEAIVNEKVDVSIIVLNRKY